jgi:ATP-dependent Clp protease ATP-binding subunit ClpA
MASSGQVGFENTILIMISNISADILQKITTLWSPSEGDKDFEFT